MTIAAIDYGTVRIGIAVADEQVRIASPLATYRRTSEVADADYFRKLVDTEGIGRFVVGLPIHLDGGESQKSLEARRFGEWLCATTGCAVDYFDERFTSVEADAFLAEAKQAGSKVTKKRRQARRDQLAAQILLTAYLEAGGKGDTDPGAIDA